MLHFNVKQAGTTRRTAKTPSFVSQTLNLSISFSLFLFVSLSLLLLLAACASPSPLKGTDLGKTPAPDFKLTDQNGAAVSLGDFRGKVVVLTFLYTHCPDECPLIASKLSVASASLGDAMSRTAYVAVTVDPENDTPVAVAKFVQQHQLEGKLRYLTGTAEQLKSVWTAYSLYVAPSPTDATFPSVSHSSRVIVIDKAGNQRANFDSDFDPADLVFDVRELLNE